jgi:predicted transcriptional regulator
MEEESKALQITFTLPADLRLKENARKVLALRFESPDLSHQQIAEQVGMTRQRVSAILRNPRVLAALPHIARQRIKNMVPKAVRAMEQLVEQNDNLIVKEKVVSRVLANEKVLDAPEILVRNEITLKTVTELQQIVQSAGFFPTNVVDTEIYTEENASNNQAKE